MTSKLTNLPRDSINNGPGGHDVMSVSLRRGAYRLEKEKAILLEIKTRLSTHSS